MPSTEDHLRVIAFIANASAEHEVLRYVSGYLSEWTREELMRLPEVCRPPTIQTADELIIQAVILARNGFDGVPLPWGPHSLEALRDVFREAAIRISALRAPAEHQERRLLH